MRLLDSYAREAGAGDKRSASIPGQHAINARRIRALGGDIGVNLDDTDIEPYTGWEKLTARLTSGVSDGVVIHDVRRFLHDAEWVARIAGLFEHGFAIYDSASGLDLTTPQERSAFLDAARGTQDYRARLSERVRDGNRQKAARGEGRRGRYRPSGFEEDGTTARESERPFLRDAALRILAGDSWQDVCDHLNGQGFRSTAQDHAADCDGTGTCNCPRRPWTTVALRSALTAPRMAGYVKLGDEFAVGRFPGTPIIDPDDWHALRMLVQSRRGRPPVDNYLCTGQDSPVRCSDCGGHLTINANGRGKTYEDGELRRYYRSPKSSGGCGKTVADWRALDKAIEAMVLDRLSSPEQLEQIRQMQELRARKVKPHEEEIARLEGLLTYWGERLNANEITEEQHRQMLDDLNARIDVERRELAKHSRTPAPRLSVEELAAFRDEWADATPARKRERLKQAYTGFQIFVTPGSSTEEDMRYRISDPTPIPETAS